MSDELRDELKTAISTYAFSGSGEEIGTEEVVVDVSDAVLMAERVVERRVAEAKAEAWDEGERHESEYLRMFGQFCPNPQNPYRVVSRG